MASAPISTLIANETLVADVVLFGDGMHTFCLVGAKHSRPGSQRPPFLHVQYSEPSAQNSACSG